MTDTKPNVRILIPLWGKKYIAEYMNYSLPALLGNGNLDLLVSECNTEVVFLTSRNHQRYFLNSRRFKVLHKMCSARFLGIDDLVAGSTSYSVPLTLAYHRGMLEAGPAMTDTFFVCLNSDFILAAHSFRPLLKHIMDDRNVILAPSFRTSMEHVRPRLKGLCREYTSPDGRLSVPPREMVKLALEHIHPTVIARTVNQGMFFSRHPDQLYWRVDEQTMLARFFLIMQLCIKPERHVRTMNGFFDYAVIPEMCPSGNVAVINDSDDLFMMEMQAIRGEAEFVGMDKVVPRNIARHAMSWTTAQHRRNAEHLLTFHADDLPDTLETESQHFDAFYERVRNGIVSPPIDHVRHHYWPGALESWLRNKQLHEYCSEQERFAPPRNPHCRFSGLRADLLPPRLGYYARVGYWKLIAFLLLYGLPPYVRWWHPLKHEYRTGLKAIKKLRRKSGPLLFVSDSNEFDKAFLSQPQVRKLWVRDLQHGGAQSLLDPMPEFSGCFVHLCELNAWRLREVLEELMRLLPDRAEIHLLISSPLDNWACRDLSPGLHGSWPSVDPFVNAMVNMASALQTIPEYDIREIIGPWKRNILQRFQSLFASNFGGGFITKAARSLFYPFLTTVSNLLCPIWPRKLLRRKLPTGFYATIPPRAERA